MVPMHLCLKNRLFVPHNLIPDSRSPVPFAKFQMALRLRFLIFSESKMKELRYACLSEVSFTLKQNVK
jgi:hypothetical protein